jgi:hypothetical protein
LGSEVELEELVKGFIEVWDTLDICLDSENKHNLLRYLPTHRYLLDVANEGLALHRGTVVGSLFKALPEFVRPMFMGLTNVRASVSPVTYIGKCRDMLELVLAYSVRLASRSRSARARVGITRIVALISRLMVSERAISLDYYTLKALLTELRLLVLTGGTL